MAEHDKSKYPPRVVFPKGKQKKFIESVLEDNDYNVDDIAKIVDLHPRTIRDWRREKLSMSLPAFNKICYKAKIKKPGNIQIKEPFWGAKSGAKKGWEAVIKKYGYFPKNEKLRKKKWHEWWNKEGKIKYGNLFKTLPINKPKPSAKLAEFFGIMLGDGGISRLQVNVTLNRVVDREYSDFVIKLMEELFKVRPSKRKRKDAIVFTISISRIKLVKFLKKLGLVVGNKIKQQIDIPGWIKNKFEYRIACLRGLVDTDGCLIIHRYKSNGKSYIYKKIGFTSRSFPLLESVRGILNELGLKHHTGSNFDIRIEAIKDVKKYFEIVGTHNPKHLKRYLN